MAEKQHPHQKHQFTDSEMHTLTQLRPMMGGPDDEDQEVEERLQRHAGEASAAKVRGPDQRSEGLGPTDAEQQLAKQQSALEQQAASSGAAQAAQAQAAESPLVNQAVLAAVKRTSSPKDLTLIEKDFAPS
jgi:hypothetical protein